MRNIIVILFCLGGFAAPAQKGFFLQPALGGGMSNTCWNSFDFKGLPGQQGITSGQAQIDIGYRTGKWQFITGLGYIRTGLQLQHGSIVNFYHYLFFPLDLGPLVPYSYHITDYNPHYMLPLEVGYQLHRFSKRLVLTPYAGAELLYNMPRTFVYYNNRINETTSAFKGACNQFGVMGLVQLNFEYALNDRYDITLGPSAHYMFSSELNFKSEHDYAILMNLGLKWHFRKQAVTTGKNGG